MSERGGTVFEQAYRVRYHDCEPRLCLSLPGALRYFEELALLQSDSLGVGFDYYHEHHVGWVLSRWDLRLGELPALGEVVTARTQPLAGRGFLATRGFWVLGPGGEACIEGRAQWIYLDTLRMRPKRISPELMALYGMYEPDGKPTCETEASPPERIDRETTLTVGRNEIDVNGHVNNVRYVEWALDSLPREAVSDRRLERLHVHYQAETRPGAELSIAAQLDEEDGDLRARHRIADGDHTACLVETRWRAVRG